MHTILLYYKYVLLDRPEIITARQKALCQKLGLKGRIIIAPEGINGTVEGTDENIEKYIEETAKIPEFSDINFKKSRGNGNSFPKLSVKTRNEIVTLGKPGLFPKAGETGARYLKADELHDFFENGKKDFVILDMRNEYEFKAGRFDNSIVMPAAHFRDIPKELEKRQELVSELRDRTVVAVCTGGVRCEKGTAYLRKELGLSNVYQLHDGIVTYMEKYPTGHFRGSLYVFDNRVTVRSEGMPREVMGKCEFCGAESEAFVNCADDACHRHFIACNSCVEKKGGSAGIFCKENCKENCRQN